MSRFAPPRADATELHDLAYRLGMLAHEMETTARRVGAAATVATSAWAGTASVVMTARSAELAGAAEAGGATLGELAAATKSYARAVELTVAEVAQLDRRYELAVENARAELRRIDALPAEARSLLADRDPMTAVCTLERALERHYDELVSALRRDGAAFEAALARGDPLAGLPEWVRAGASLGAGALMGHRLVTRGSAYGSWLIHTAKAAYVAPAAMAWWTGSSPVGVRAAAELSLRLRAADAAFARFTSGVVAPRGALAGVRTVAGKAYLPLTAVNGAVDLVTGGGYPGLRGIATRAAGGIGAAGGGALVAAMFIPAVSLGPVGIAVAGAAVLTYAAWSLGNLAVDNWDAIRSFPGRAARAVVTAPRRILSALIGG